MLTAKQFEAVGRFTLAFNAIDDAFADYITMLTGTSAKSRKFHQKAERFNTVLEDLAKDRPDVVQFQISVVRKLVEDASELAKRRNKYVHALVRHDFATNQTTLENRDAILDCDEKTISEFAAEAHCLAWKVHEECGALLDMLNELREKNDGPEVPLPNGWGGREGG